MQTYLERSTHCKNAAAKKLLQIMDEKKTNLALSADVTKKQQLLALADSCGPEICMLKTHIDIIEDFDTDLIQQLQKLAEQHQFILFEDRKFADIGNTVKLQYEKGIFHIAQWAAITNAYVISGPGIIDALKEVGAKLNNGLLLMAELSSEGNLLTDTYRETVIQLAKKNPDFVIGFIAQKKLSDEPQFIYACPGVNLASKNDQLGQQYNTPEHVIINNGVDIIIVGRGIYAAENSQAAAREYRNAGWNAYQSLLKK